MWLKKTIKAPCMRPIKIHHHHRFILIYLIWISQKKPSFYPPLTSPSSSSSLQTQLTLYLQESTSIQSLNFLLSIVVSLSHLGHFIILQYVTTLTWLVCVCHLFFYPSSLVNYSVYSYLDSLVKSVRFQARWKN